MKENFVVGWGTPALINAAIAQMKNRSAANWLLLSLFFGPIATAMLVLLSKYEPAPQEVQRHLDMERKLRVVNTLLIVLILAAIVFFLVRSYLF